MSATVGRSGTVIRAGICGTVLFLAACQAAGSRSSFPPGHSTVPVEPTPSPIPTATGEPLPPSSAEPTPTALATGYCGSATLSIDYSPFTTSDLAAAPWKLVVADVTGFGPAFFNTEDGTRPPELDPYTGPSFNPNAETLIYTPVDVVIDHSITGDLLPGPNRFLVAGGVVGCYTMSVYPSPVVEVGSRYVFILAAAFDNLGQDELPFKDARFAWPVDDDGTVNTVDGPMSIEELTAIVTATPSLPPI